MAFKDTCDAWELPDDPIDLSAIVCNLPLYLEGLWVTIQLVAMALALGLLLASVLVYDCWSWLRPDPAGSRLRIALIQPNVPLAVKHEPSSAGEQWRLLVDLSLEAAEADADLIVWPESARPLTLFFDGSIAELRTGDVVDDDAQVLKGTGGVDGLWSRDTPFGSLGFYGDWTHDGTIVSHHVLTTGGILGRDRLSR